MTSPLWGGLLGVRLWDVSPGWVCWWGIGREKSPKAGQLRGFRNVDADGTDKAEVFADELYEPPDVAVCAIGFVSEGAKREVEPGPAWSEIRLNLEAVTFAPRDEERSPNETSLAQCSAYFALL